MKKKSHIKELEKIVVMLTAGITGLAIIADERYNDLLLRVNKLESILEKKRLRVEESG